MDPALGDSGPVPGLPKSWPADARGVAPERVGERGWSLLHDFATPICALDEADLAHNLATVARWCGAQGVDLAPHGKTTMSPELISRQLAHGAWAITAATP